VIATKTPGGLQELVEEKMGYLVTHAAANERQSPAGIDEPLTLEAGLALACQLLSEGRHDVAIQDGNGRRISGEELAACCRGEKTLTTDLFR